MQLALKTDPPPMQEDAHGVLRIAGTRVTLDSLVERYDQGASAEEIALGFKSLKLHEVYAALGYYLAHRGALDAYLRQRRHVAVETQAQAERRCPPTEVRAWLAARREALHIWDCARTDGELLGMMDFGFSAVGVNPCRFLREN